MVLPLDHSSLPVNGSSTYKTALADWRTRSAMLNFASAGRYSPLETANITPFTMIGVNGEIISRETQPGSNLKVPLFSVSRHATIAPAEGERIQRVPAWS